MNLKSEFVPKGVGIMSGSAIDRRVQKTRRLLQDALIELIAERGFESVTIQEILDRANVGRSTFYIHFENKNELLHSCLEDFNNLLDECKRGITGGKNGSPVGIDFTLHLFRFVEKNHRLFKALFGKDSIAILNHPIHDYFLNCVGGALRQSNVKRSPLHLEMLANYISSAYIGTLKWWVDKDMPFSVEEVDKYFRQFALIDVREALGFETKSLPHAD